MPNFLYDLQEIGSLKGSFMRILIAIFATIMIVACSSAEKQSGPPPSQPQSPQSSSQSLGSPPAPDMHEDFEVFKTETCESGTDSRTLEVRKKKVGCDLSYTRFGKEKIVSSGKHGTKRCEKSMDKIIKKLKAQKYTCTP